MHGSINRKYPLIPTTSFFHNNIFHSIPPPICTEECSISESFRKLYKNNDHHKKNSYRQTPEFLLPNFGFFLIATLVRELVSNIFLLPFNTFFPPIFFPLFLYYFCLFFSSRSSSLIFLPPFFFLFFLFSIFPPSSSLLLRKLAFLGFS